MSDKLNTADEVLTEALKIIRRVCDETDPAKKCPAEIAVLPELMKVVLNYYC